jgi:isoquinoline 1-oxidoreductase subunit alpha
LDEGARSKFGCGAGLCGACTVHVNSEAVRSCQTSVSDAVGKKITTIEGLSAKGDHPLQKAWIAEQVPQCGYCQSGQIMQAAALLAKNSNPTKEEVVAHMDGNLCRCMTYSRIQKAIMRAAAFSASRSMSCRPGSVPRAALISDPTASIWPGAPLIEMTLPAAGEGISTVALSVITSTMC